MNLEALKSSLELHEGNRPLMYKDTNDIYTVGIGHNMQRPLSAAAIDQIFRDDIEIAIAELDRAFPSWRQHSENRQAVLAELMFAMGAPTLGQFHRFWFCMQQKDYSQAALELMDSQWAKQVKGRAVTLSDRLARDVAE